MGEVFRIVERFEIQGRGPIYMLKCSTEANLKLDDVLFDLQGNRFRVKGLEHMRFMISYVEPKDRPIGVLVELLDGREAEGKILINGIKDINFIFCNHPLYQKKVDEDYEQEYQAAGLNHECALFSYEDLEKGKLSLYGPEISGLTVYRGWMMKPEMYKLFYTELEKKGIILINSPEEYERYHTLPGWYREFENHTAPSVWEDKGTVESAMAISKGLEGSYIVKDYVKSRKHEWYDACFIEDITDKKKSEKIISRFVERQGDNLVGGVVLRKFVNLKSIGKHEKSGMPISEEYRVFVFGGRIGIMDDYWQEGQEINLSEEEMDWIKALVKKIRSNFVTIDLARREDGQLIVMELGDGQVSGLQQIKPEAFYRDCIDPACERLRCSVQRHRVSMEKTEEEIQALDYKMEHPSEIVICPRCGKFLLFKAIGNSCEIKCETEGCLYGGSRGL